MGIANTNSAVLLDATFAPVVPPRGRVGFSSQSGALGLAIIEFANSLGLGISTFVSVGNKADSSGNDLLRYWEADDDTDVILLYLESFGNPKKFSQIRSQVINSLANRHCRALVGSRISSVGSSKSNRFMLRPERPLLG
jgi:acetate---CoA ligase (ADP-forming)